MSAISDSIEKFILSLLEEEDAIELQRNELAHYFSCAPSQINYVLATRFNLDRGYAIESRRGGGGYIRIRRVVRSPAVGIMHIVNNIGEKLNAFDAQALLRSMEDNGYIDGKERCVMSAAASDSAYQSVPPLVRDKLRASLVKNMLLSLIVK